LSLFEEHVLVPVKAGLDKPDSGIPIPMEKLSKYTNYIEKSQIITVGGRSGSGKTSLADYLYFVNVFNWWRKLGMIENEDGELEPIPGYEKPKIKLIYFNMNTSAKLKIQKWLCLYLKLEHDLIIDIPTLNSGVGRLYDLDQNAKDKIEAAYEFFEELEENLILINGAQTPSSIYNRVCRYMEGIGSVEEGTYSLDEDHKDQITMVYIDNVKSLATESDGYHTMNEDALRRKMAEYVSEFKDKYKVTSIIISPTKSNNYRNVKDSEPNYRELGVFNEISDIGLVAYNPYEENNNKYLNYPIEELQFKGKNRFRTVTIVRNANGVSNVTVGCVFLGECGYFRESPTPLEVEDWEDIYEILRELP